MYLTVSDENSLIVACKKKEAWARRQLYERYAPAMMGICARYSDSLSSAEDILQEGFYRIFTKIDTYKGEGSFEGWMRRVFVNTALEMLRKTRPVISMEMVEETLFFETFDVSVLDRLTADEICKYISELPAGYRTVFNLYAVEGYTHEEIAEMLHIESSTSRSQYHHARALLQKKIKQFYS
ncbi:MAG: sigma-70 family RNA polymerase sigma factor [Dysgonamonadaceae bacterium]|jgi:RNA polymerase sigma-70 factor (ECF subfamily)|nr:sigma-70 family RNA polymerase sigma factor [Dysgonamonadaceae bacterium]